MTDIADGRAAFAAAMRRAEESAGITRDAEGNETVASETPEAITELSEAVPVTASDQPLTPEPVAATATPEEQETQAPPAVETLQAEIDRLQGQLEDRQSFIGRQSTEVGELRKMVDDLTARVDARTATPQAPQVMVAPVSQDDIDRNPAEATVRAFAQKDENALARAYEAWEIEEPARAAVWLTEQRFAQREEALRAELAATQQEIKTRTAPLEQNAAQAEWSTAFNEVQRLRPDFLQQAERLLEEVAPNFPAIVSVLASGNAKAKAEVLTALYDLDKIGNPEQVKQELEQQAQEAAAEAAAARAGAAAVSSQTTAGQSTVDKTDEETEQEAYIARMGTKPSLTRGWTGR